MLGLLEVHLTECAHLENQHGAYLPSAVQSAVDLVEAQIRSGAIADAERSLAVLEEKVCWTGLRWRNAGAAWCRGMLADEDHYKQEFETALSLYGEQMGFERARTQLALGMRRRRSRRRAAGRAALHESLAYFARNGAEPWAEQARAEQARAELRASGEPASRETTGNMRSLTAQKLQMILIVTQGITNRDAAAALFLSPKQPSSTLTRHDGADRVRRSATLLLLGSVINLSLIQVRCAGPAPAGSLNSKNDICLEIRH
jgi:hypothetical protein